MFFVIFNGNSYDLTWQTMAKERGLENYTNSMELYKLLQSPEIVNVFAQTKVLDSCELNLRKSTLEQNYVQTVLLEANTMNQMFNQQILPSLNSMLMLNSVRKQDSKLVNERYEKLNITIENLLELNNKLLLEINKIKNNKKNTVNNLILIMQKIRNAFNQTEFTMYDNLKPFPNYNDILFN